MEETEDPPSFVGGEVEEALHQEDRKSLQSDSEKDEQTSDEDQ